MNIKKWLKSLVWGTVAGVVTLIGYAIFSLFWYPQAFLHDSVSEMRHYASPMQVPDVYKRRFADGSSVAIAMEHACCSGRGYNATVVYDSEGKIFVNTEHSFCGEEGLAADMSSVPAKSLAQFYSHLPFLPLRKYEK